MTDDLFREVQPGRSVVLHPEDDPTHDPDTCSCEAVSYCPACGEPIDFCQGHGPIGDPAGADILWRHDGDDHSTCHPDGCETAYDVAHLAASWTPEEGTRHD